MICSCERRCRADSGSGSMSRRLPISTLIKSRRCFDAPLVDLLETDDVATLLGGDATLVDDVMALNSASHILGVLKICRALLNPLRTSTCAPRPIFISSKILFNKVSALGSEKKVSQFLLLVVVNFCRLFASKSPPLLLNVFTPVADRWPTWCLSLCFFASKVSEKLQQPVINNCWSCFLLNLLNLLISRERNSSETKIVKPKVSCVQHKDSVFFFKRRVKQVFFKISVSSVANGNRPAVLAKSCVMVKLWKSNVQFLKAWSVLF